MRCRGARLVVVAPEAEAELAPLCSLVRRSALACEAKAASVAALASVAAAGGGCGEVGAASKAALYASRLVIVDARFLYSCVVTHTAKVSYAVGQWSTLALHMPATSRQRQ